MIRQVSPMAALILAGIALYVVVFIAWAMTPSTRAVLDYLG